MTCYWYSTNGMSQRRLSSRHLSILDQAFERHARIQIFDDEIFGHNVPAIANPYQGTMTAGDLHFGLYRQPPMWRMSDTSLDTLILMDVDDSKINRHSTGQPENNTDTIKYSKFMQNQRKRIVQQGSVEEHCICCRIS
jgi:hypothetical protein